VGRGKDPFPTNPKTAKILFWWSRSSGFIPPLFIVILSEAKDLLFLCFLGGVLRG